MKTIDIVREELQRAGMDRELSLSARRWLTKQVKRARRHGHNPFGVVRAVVRTIVRKQERECAS